MYWISFIFNNKTEQAHKKHWWLNNRLKYQYTNMHMIQVKYHVDCKQSTSSNFKISTIGKIYSVEKPLLNNSAKTIRDTIKKIMQHVHEWRTQWQLTIKLNNPRLFVHIIIGVTFFISHLFITIYNILTYQVVLFLVKKKKMCLK